MTNSISFSTAFKYPFNRAKGLLNILWILVPVFGWFAVGGYSFRIIQEFLRGEFKQLPLFSFKSDMKLGWKAFVRSLPFFLAYILLSGILGIIGEFGSLFASLASLVQTVVDLFIVPILSMNFVQKLTVESYFEFDLVNHITSNLGDYIEALLKTIGLIIIYAIMCVVLVGIPALSFVPHIFIADFYRRKVLSAV